MWGGGVSEYLEDINPGLLSSEASHLGELVQCLDADAAILVCSVLHKGPHAVAAHLSHALIQLNIDQHTLHTCTDMSDS